MRDENRVRAFWQIDRIVIRKIEQQREHANLDVLQVTDALAQHRMRVTTEPLRPLEHHNLERLLGAEVLADQFLDGGDELLIIQDRALYVEDRCLLRTRGGLDALANLAKAFFRSIKHVVQVLDLTAHRVVGNDAMPNFRDLPTKEMDRTDGDAGRRGDTEELAIHSAFPEPIVHELRERVERLIGIRALGAQRDR